MNTLLSRRKRKIAIEAKSMQMTPASGNVFVDLRFTPEVAAKPKAYSQRLISLKPALQGHLITELADWIEANCPTQANAAQILGRNRQRVSRIINERGTMFSIDSLVTMLARAGKGITLCGSAVPKNSSHLPNSSV